MGIFDAVLPAGRPVQDGVPIAKGVLPQGYGAVRWLNGSNEVKCDSRPLTYWPDGSIRHLWVSSRAHSFSNLNFSLEYDPAPDPALTPTTPTATWLKDHITAQVTTPDGTGLYRWEPNTANLTHHFVGAYSEEFEVWGWFKNPSNPSQRWTWGRAYLIQRRHLPGVWECWFQHSNMQPRGTAVSNGQGGWNTVGYKRGALKVRHYRIWPSTAGRATDIDYWMHPTWYESYPFFTQKDGGDSQSPRIVPMNSYVWDDPNNPNGNNNGAYYSYFSPPAGWREWEFLEDGASQITRFFFKEASSTYTAWESKLHLPHPLRPQNPDSVVGYWEADGLLPFSQYTDEVDSFQEYRSWNGYQGHTGLGDFSDSTPPNVKYKLRRVMCRHQEYINSHQPGYGRMFYYFDIPQLMGVTGVGREPEDYFNMMVLCGISEVERPCQHNWLDPDDDSIIHEWRHTRTTYPGDTPYWSNDRYYEGHVSGSDGAPSPDYDSITVAEQPENGGSWNHRDIDGRQEPYIASDAEHSTCPDLQAYIRTGMPWFRERVIHKADVLLDSNYGWTSRPFSERVVAYSILIRMNASRLFSDPNVARVYYLRAPHVLTAPIGVWSYEGYYRTESNNEVSPVPVPVNDYSAFPPKFHLIDYSMKPIFNIGISTPSQVSMWMGSQAVQAIAILIREELDWITSGFAPSFSLNKALGTIRDTLRAHMLKSILPGHYSPSQGPNYTFGGYYYRMPDDVDPKSDLWPEPLGYDGSLVWANDWLRNDDDGGNQGGTTAKAFFGSTSQWNILGIGSVMRFGENYMTVEIIEWARRMAEPLLNALSVDARFSHWNAALEHWWQQQIGCIDVPY